MRTEDRVPAAEAVAAVQTASDAAATKKLQCEARILFLSALSTEVKFAEWPLLSPLVSFAVILPKYCGFRFIFTHLDYLKHSPATLVSNNSPCAVHYASNSMHIRDQNT